MLLCHVFTQWPWVRSLSSSALTFCLILTCFIRVFVRVNSPFAKSLWWPWRLLRRLALEEAICKCYVLQQPSSSCLEEDPPLYPVPFPPPALSVSCQDHLLPEADGGQILHSTFNLQSISVICSSSVCLPQSSCISSFCCCRGLCPCLVNWCPDTTSKSLLCDEYVAEVSSCLSFKAGSRKPFLATARFRVPLKACPNILYAKFQLTLPWD